MKTGFVIAAAAALALSTGCTTVKPLVLQPGPDVALSSGATASSVTVPVAVVADPSPLEELAAGIDKLIQHPLFTAVLNDANKTMAWVNGPSGPTDPLAKFQASACPTAVILAAQDFQAKAAMWKAAILALDARLKGINDGSGPDLIYRLTVLRYGTKSADPQAQISQIKADIFARVSAVADSCRMIVPAKQIDEVLMIARKAGVMSVSGGTLAPIMKFLP